LLLYKEEGFSKVQGTVELAQTVLANTAPSGHDAINQILGKLQEEWSALALKMIETKVSYWITYYINISVIVKM
jgi:nesprin-1